MWSLSIPNDFEILKPRMFAENIGLRDLQSVSSDCLQKRRTTGGVHLRVCSNIRQTVLARKQLSTPISDVWMVGFADPPPHRNFNGFVNRTSDVGVGLFLSKVLGPERVS